MCGGGRKGQNVKYYLHKSKKSGGKKEKKGTRTKENKNLWVDAKWWRRQGAKSDGLSTTGEGESRGHQAPLGGEIWGPKQKKGHRGGGE